MMVLLLTDQVKDYPLSLEQLSFPLSKTPNFSQPRNLQNSSTTLKPDSEKTPKIANGKKRSEISSEPRGEFVPETSELKKSPIYFKIPHDCFPYRSLELWMHVDSKGGRWKVVFAETRPLFSLPSFGSYKDGL
jgi:hypothetical protein